MGKPAIKFVFAPIKCRGLTEEDRKKGLRKWGETKGRTIWLDPRVALVDTIVHELIHVRHPSWTEEQVIAATEKRIKRMTCREAVRYLRMIADAKLEGEEDEENTA